MITTGPIETFFKSPAEEPSRGGDCVLYHLRTDLESLYGKEPVCAFVSDSHVLLATTGILNGIDYISQASSTETNQRRRFVETLRDLTGLTSDDAEALYQLRCAVVHQVGLSVKSQSYKKGTRFVFELSDEANAPTIRQVSKSTDEASYAVGFWKLKQVFVTTVHALRQICKNPEHNKNRHVINRVGEMHSEKIVRN